MTCYEIDLYVWLLTVNQPYVPAVKGRVGLVKNILKSFETDGINFVGSVVEQLRHRAHDQHGLGSKPTHAILLCPWERHFVAHSPAWWSWQAVLNYSHISIKLQVDSNILASPEAVWDNCLPYVLAPPSLSCESRR